MAEKFRIQVGGEKYEIKVLETEIDHVQYEVCKADKELFILEQVNEDDSRCWVTAHKHVKDKDTESLIEFIGDEIEAHYNK